MTGLTLGLIGIGVWRLTSASEEIGSRPRTPAQERVFNVDVGTLEARTVTPVITAFGQVRAWRKLEIRTAESGPIIEISPNFRDGAIVSENELLFRIDPADHLRRVRDAEVALELAKANLAEASDALPLAVAEVRNSRRQLALKKNNLQRQSRLKGRGIVAEASVDTAELDVNVAEQSLTTKQKAELTARARIRSEELAVERARIGLADADKALQDTVYRAPFSGPLTEVVATLGKRVSQNEKLGVLIDPASLEVSFRVSEEEFGRLLSDGLSGTLRKLRVTAQIDLGTRQITFDGVLDRAASETDLTAGGRTIFARIDADLGLQIRPGDFVSVKVFEEPLENMAVIPAVAATTEGEIFLVTDDNRLELRKTDIVRWQADTLLVRNVPFGREYVAARQPFLAAGVKVKPVRAGAPTEPTHMRLSDDRRNRLIKAVESRTRMPDFVKQRLLETLKKPEVPIAMVERMESRMRMAAARRGTQSSESDGGGEMIALSDERRAALTRFVTDHPRMPTDVKQRLLARLAEPKVPAAMVERLESRLRQDQQQ